MDSLRLCASEELVPLLAPGFVVLQSLQGDAESISPALGRAVDEQLGAVGASGEARLELASRTFVAEETQRLVEALQAINSAFEQRRTATCGADVVLLMQNLFEESRGDDEARKATAKFLQSLDAERPHLSRVQLRVWLLDGQSADGSSYGIQDVQGIISRLDFRVLGAKLPTMAKNHFTLGGRAVSFPRAQLLDYLGTRFALRVLEHEKGIDGELLPYASIAHECSSFIDEDVVGIVKDMERDEFGQPIIPTPTPPMFSPDDPANTNLTRIHQCIDPLVDEIGSVEDQLLRRCKIAVADLAKALDARVGRCIDEPQGGVETARAFLDILGHSASPLVAGDQVETGKAQTLRQAFTAAFEFFDSVTQFDSSQRTALADVQQEAAAQRRWVTTMESDQRIAQEKAAKGEDGAAARAEALGSKIVSVQEEETQTKNQLDELTRVITAQDWDVQTNKKEIERGMLAEIETEIAAAREKVEKSVAEVDESRDAARKAEADLRSVVQAMLLKAAGLVLGVVLVGLLGVLLLPLVFGAVAVVGAPLFGFIGTVVGVGFAKVWGIGAIAALVTYATAQIVRYRRLRHKVDELNREFDARKATLAFNVRKYWDAYSKKFTKRCDLIRYGHVFDTDRELEKAVDTLSADLEAFQDGLRGFRKQAQDVVDSFALKSTSTELVVVQRPWVEDVVQRKSDLVDERAKTFFQAGHVLSQYFDKWQLDNSGVAALGHDTREYCAGEIFEDILSTGVVQAIKEEHFDLAAAVKSAPLFLPVNTSEPPESLLVLLGPDEEFLRDATDRIVPKPEVVGTAEEEQILLLRIAHGIELANVTVLGTK